MTVFFGNKGAIDLDTIRVMGVNVKDTESPIGFFGTGLKYAIAVLLRTGNRVSLWREGKEYKFTTETRMIRNAPFDLVFMNDEKMPFTTDLGRNWEIWQAYRELYSNMLDENGEASEYFPDDADTIFAVDGVGFHKVHMNKSKYFIDEYSIEKVHRIELYPGPSSMIFYKGIAAGQLAKPSRYKINITSDEELSEDRLIKSIYAAEAAVEFSIPRSKNSTVIDSILNPDGNNFGDYWEDGLHYSHLMETSYSKEFLEIARRYSKHPNVNKTVLRALEKAGIDTLSYTPANLSSDEQDLLKQACHNLRNFLDITLVPEDIFVAETLGPDVFGQYAHKTNQIYIAKQTFDRGEQFLTSTLYEEALHKIHGFHDESRSMQDFLIDKVTKLALKSK